MDAQARAVKYERIMAKRIYKNTVLRWAENNKYIVGGTATVGTLIGLYFLYLSFIGAILITGYSGDEICAGTLDDPCYAFINFTAQEDIFIYPLDYDPYNRDMGVSFDPNVKDWKMERSWGSGWREIDLNDTCKGTWCGGKYGSKTNVYSFAFREGRDYQIRLTAHKNINEDIKWGFGELDPVWIAVDNIKHYDSNTETVEIKDAVTFNTIVYLKLETPKINFVGAGYQKVAQIRINSRTDINQLIQSFEFHDLKDSNRIINRSIDLKYLTIQPVEEDTFEVNCSQSQNGTEFCQNIKNGTQTVYKEKWIDFNNSVKFNQELILGLFTEVRVGDKIEWIPNIQKTRIDEWASWTQSLNVDLISYYKLDGTPDPVTDELGANDGTNTGATSGATGIINNAYDFETTEGDYVTVDDGTGTISDITDGNMSINMWVKLESGNLYHRFFQGATNGFCFGSTNDATPKLAFGKCGVNEVLSTDNVGVGAWHMITVVYDGDANLVYFYINATADSGGTDAYSNTFSADVEYNIGRTGGGAISLDAVVDEVGIWNRSLSADEITQLYNGGTGITHATFGPTIILNSPIDNFNSSSQSITFNGTAYDDINLINVSFILDSTYNETNTTGLNNSNYIFSLTTISEGTHNWTYEACDNSSLCTNATVRDFEVDLTNPTIDFVSPTESAGAIKERNYIEVNVTATDSGVGLNTIVIRLYNSSVIEINSSTSTTSPNFANFTGLSEGLYFYNATANDTSGNENSTETRNITLDTTIPLIEFVSPTENNNSVFDNRDWIFVNVSVIEAFPQNITYILFNSTKEVNETTFLMTDQFSNNTINFTGLPDETYYYNVTIVDVISNSNSTGTRIIYLTTLSLFLGGIAGNISAELNAPISLIANSTAPGLTICVDIDHPDYGINYTCETDSSDYNISIEYFRNTTFSDLTTNVDLNFSNYSVYNLTLVSHQYDEVEGLTFNISGTTNPTNTIFFRANTTPDITNLTQYEPLIDRYYDGRLVGSNVYDFALSDGSNSSNVTFQNEGEQFVYLLIDDVLQNRLDYTFFLNVTGFLFGFFVDYGHYPEHSIGDGLGFLDYDFVDMELTTAHTDRSGIIMAGNVSSINHVFDDFEDGVLDQSLWSNDSCVIEATYRTCADETGGNLRMRTWADVGGTASIPHTVFTQDSPELPLTVFESEVINFSIVVDYDGYDSSSDATLSDGSAHIQFFDNQVWDLVVLDTTSGIGAAERADADIDFMFEKINRTHWRMTMWGSENSTAGGKPPSNIVYNGDQTIIPIDNWNEGVRLYVFSYAKNGVTSNDFFVSEINRTVWNRANSTLISKSIFDSSGFIDAASMEISVANNTAYNKGDENISLYMSADDGDNWEFVTWTIGNETEFGEANFVFANQGKHLKFRLDFNSSNWDYNSTMLILHLNVSVSEGNVSNLTFDFGDDGTADFTFPGELNSTNSPQEINLSFVNISSAFTDVNRFTNNSFTYPHLYEIPLSIYSDSRGTLQIDAINLTYSPNPVSLNITPILNALSNSVNATLFRIPIAASNSSVGANASINFGDIRYNYKGGKDNVTVLLHDPSYTLNTTWTITNYYSDFYKNLPYTWATDIFFLPRTNSSKNVSAYGQTTTTPIFNITATNYGGMDLNFSLKVNETFSCMDITWNATGSAKPADQKLNTSLQKITSDVGYLSNTQVWLWADLDNCNASQSRILSPYIFIDSCCIGCEVCL